MDTQTTKRLNVNLPERFYIELQGLASESGRTLTELVRLSLGLVAVAIKETERGNRLVVTDPNGKEMKEILLPK